MALSRLLQYNQMLLELKLLETLNFLHCKPILISLIYPTIGLTNFQDLQLLNIITPGFWIIKSSIIQDKFKDLESWL